MRKFKKRLFLHPYCKVCFWGSACPERRDHDVDPSICTRFYISDHGIRKPNYWLYFSGDLALCAACVLFAWLGLKYDNAGAFFIVGAFSVMASNVTYEYQQRLREYQRYLREREVHSND